MDEVVKDHIADSRVVYRRGWLDPEDLKGIAGQDLRPNPAEFILDDEPGESDKRRKKDRFSAYIDDEGVTPREVATAPPPPGHIRRPRNDAIVWEIPVSLIRQHGMEVVRSPQPHPPELGTSHVDVVCSPNLTLTQRKHQRNELLKHVGLADGEYQHLLNMGIEDS